MTDGFIGADGLISDNESRSPDGRASAEPSRPMAVPKIDVEKRSLSVYAAVAGGL
jgi:hypothetical protein